MVSKLNNKAQYKIQQMAFMILAIFFFFALVGIFFIGWQFDNLNRNFSKLQEEKALSALAVIADSTELNCDQNKDWCIDKDKLIAFSENNYLYTDFFSAASIEVLMVYPRGNERKTVYKISNSSSSSTSSNISKVQYSSGRSAGGVKVNNEEDSLNNNVEEEITYGSEPILCPGENCDYYILYDNGQKNKQTYSAYVTVCETVERGSIEICELAKLILGVKISDKSKF